MLSAESPLPFTPLRIAVAGPSGVGKTTLCAELARRTGAEHIEIDALFHGPDWTPRPQFVDEVRGFLARDAWVTEWQYSPARPLISQRAQLLVWLDLPFWRVTFPQVVRRTVGRSWGKKKLWNGNVEPPLRTIFSDPEHIIRWSVQTRNLYRERVPVTDAQHPGLTVVRLRSRRQVRAWLDANFSVPQT